MRLTYLGHSTVLIEIGGTRVLTDPVLRSRVIHLERRAAPVDLSAARSADVVLVSHLHHDHFDPASLRLLDRSATLVVPRGARVAGLGFSEVVELEEGERRHIAGVDVAAVPARHEGGRWPWRRGTALGYTLAAGERLYFAGDTDLFEGMAELGGPFDVALLPVWGWGTRVGPGHLNPLRAARSLELLRPRVAVPIHWGTLYPIGLRRFRPHLMTEPPRAFAREAARLAPGVDVRILEPGAMTVVE